MGFEATMAIIPYFQLDAVLIVPEKPAQAELEFVFMGFEATMAIIPYFQLDAVLIVPEKPAQADNQQKRNVNSKHKNDRSSLQLRISIKHILRRN
ncbi:hypothetical protein AVEN_209352-1 [Araneus ventricosus]|uniref:Uncharacterized protein n=1 Tax=Araneus ventricosus TaxID=182803 RepID=A0A4Y2SG26_ARAVE|nr:hypothetical protein AVEN_180498-1 [Araneus ventricosus]GBN87198.1 hypothetical protein AVEN_209352-1 [Araneus ventricosus]